MSLFGLYDGCEVSTRPYFFESDLPCFWIGPSLFWLRPSVFRVRRSHFLGQSFPKSVLLIFRLRHSHFFGSLLFIFRVRPSHFFRSIFPTFSGQCFSFFSSDLLPIFFTVSFRLLPVICSDLIAICTVDKIKDVGVCRKRLHCTKNSLARETNQQNTNR